ncbi:hypothetical protein NECAME_07764 [Necator americanus]|uniref:Uncharacterized protein n=1 Tax=Necator americanus TaxID=51031 RepID=W2TM54_NECAM|nr:hypothetical protein NECAME_07764 [Necator americanus]ETN82818.1 hypothetical protein NECAME_07764 [Necator americanus]
MLEIAELLDMDHSTVVRHLKQIRNVKKLDSFPVEAPNPVVVRNLYVFVPPRDCKEMKNRTEACLSSKKQTEKEYHH